MVSFVVNTAAALDGSGTQEDPWRIKSLDDFNDFAADANYWAGFTRLETDVNLSGKSYSTAVIAPDTNNTTWYFIGTPFTGIFNGNNHTIHNLTIDTTGTNNNYYIGLFGQLRSSAVVSNLRLQNANITGGTDTDYLGGLCGANGDCDLRYDGGTINNCDFNGFVTSGNSSYFVGGLVGLNYLGAIQNCYTTGSVSSHRYSGGMVGWNFYGTISNCYTNSYVDGGYGSDAVGGLVGCSESSTISNCRSNGYITGGSVGGLVGEQIDGDINNCYASGSVNANEVVGNLVGRNSNGSISNCYSAGTVTGKYTIGGLVGYNYFGTISSCHAADSVIGGDNSARLGGLAGWNEGTTKNCYATGTVTGGISSSHLGGLVGRNGRIITNCYAAGTLSSGTDSSNLAGLCGFQWGYYAQMSNCFWDTESTGMSVGYNLSSEEPGTIENVFGKTTAEMKKKSTFTDSDWDFINVWNIGENQTYPYLRTYLPSDINKDGIVNFLDVAITANQWMEGVE
jgi:hypothetical protein